MSHFKIIPGKDVINNADNPDDVVEIRFKVEDNASVPGAGMPITKRLCRKIVHDYHLLQMDIYNQLRKLPEDPLTKTLIESVNPDNEVVSGIYGKETIMHILEQPGCEGIRYINCIYGGEKSIVLIGVDINGDPVGPKDSFLTDSENADGSSLVIYEVKPKGTTRSEILKLIPPQASGSKSNG